MAFYLGPSRIREDEPRDYDCVAFVALDASRIKKACHDNDIDSIVGRVSALRCGGLRLDAC